MPQIASGKPPKPYESFPLFAHARGYWAKTIDGRHKPFGKWAWPDHDAYEKSWRAALDAFKQHEEDIALGRVLATKPERMSVEALVDAYLTWLHGRAVGKEAEITKRYFGECKSVLTHFRDVVGRTATIAELERFDPSRPRESLIMHYIEAVDYYGWCQFNNRMTAVSSMFTWAEHPIRGVLRRPFRLKALLERRKEKIKLRGKRLKEADLGKMRWTPDELAALLAHAAQPLRTMLKLGYYAAFGNSDCSDTPQTAIVWDPDKSLGLPEGWGLLQWRRSKTEVSRAAVLPKDLIDDLREAIAIRPEPAVGAPADWGNRIFLTRWGAAWVRTIVYEEPDRPGQIKEVVTCDAVGEEFRKLRGRLSRCPEHGWFAAGRDKGQGFRSDKKEEASDCERARRRPKALKECPTCGKEMKPMRKLGFYTTRHTSATYASGAADVDTLHLFEGHAIPGIRREYIEEVEIPRLLPIAKRLMEKLESAKPSAPQAVAVAKIA